MDHHIMLVIDLCQSFKFGHLTSLKDLNNLLFIPFTKCLNKKYKKYKLYSFHIHHISNWCLICGNTLDMSVLMVVLLSDANTLIFIPTASKYLSNRSQASTSIWLLLFTWKMIFPYFHDGACKLPVPTVASYTCGLKFCSAKFCGLKINGPTFCRQPYVEMSNLHTWPFIPTSKATIFLVLTSWNCLGYVIEKVFIG